MVHLQTLQPVSCLIKASIFSFWLQGWSSRESVSLQAEWNENPNPGGWKFLSCPHRLRGLSSLLCKRCPGVKWPKRDVGHPTGLRIGWSLPLCLSRDVLGRPSPLPLLLLAQLRFCYLPLISYYSFTESTSFLAPLTVSLLTAVHSPTVLVTLPFKFAITEKSQHVTQEMRSRSHSLPTADRNCTYASSSSSSARVQQLSELLRWENYCVAKSMAPAISRAIDVMSKNSSAVNRPTTRSCLRRFGIVHSSCCMSCLNRVSRANRDKPITVIFQSQSPELLPA